MVDISFIIVNWNTRDILINCLNSIYKTVKDVDYKICVVDNNSTDGSQEAIKKHFPEVNLIENKTNAGFAHANNQALKIMQSRFTVLLNSDTILQEEAIKNLTQINLSTPGCITITDRFRFLKEYLKPCNMEDEKKNILREIINISKTEKILYVSFKGDVTEDW